MPQSHLLIVVIDGLRASALGAYGNTSNPTPALDQFAAESLLFDQCMAPAADIEAICRAMWSSRHPLRDRSLDRLEASLPAILQQAGYATTLVSDDPVVLSMSSAAGFANRIAGETRGIDFEDSPSMVRVMAIASEVVAEADGRDTPQLVWLHMKGLYGPWEAPAELQERLLDDEDPLPVTDSEPPDFVAGTDNDADCVFRYGCAYAAQIMLLDDCFGGLMETLRATGTDDRWLTMLIGARGFPLGEHRRVGGVDDRLYVEQLHVPWQIRFPDRRGRLSRCDGLVSHLDLSPTIVDWVRGNSDQASTSELAGDGVSVLPWATRRMREWRHELLSSADRSLALRTSEWSLRLESAVHHREDGSDAAELYVRPDDRWEANDVASRCPDVAARLADRAFALRQQIRRGEPMQASLAAPSPPEPVAKW